MPDCVEVSKSQSLRLWDVFWLGPFLIYYALQTRKSMGSLADLMLLAGVLTIAYNWRNYRLTVQANENAPAP
jgi:hypothetical protein